MKPIGAALAVALPFANPVLAEGFTVSPPIDCDLTSDCYIQQYVDSDPSPNASDFTCSSLSYDGHKGTDFALPNRARINDNVGVLASAAGKVKSLRDGMVDAPYSDARATEIAGRECGNGVVVDHGDGWETQYCHMKQGSINVTRGQDVWRGQMLGFVGQSGKAAFPHVHLSVRRAGKVVDPFDPDGITRCDSPGDSNLWTQRPAYQPGGLIAIGISSAVPAYDDIKAGLTPKSSLPAASPALVVWGFLYGTQAGDIINLSITGPDGMIIVDDVTLTKTQAQAFRAIGKKTRTGWSTGAYSATVTMIRGPQVISQRSTDIVIE
tara:strand:+ start:2193 stop:3161 length:969 start_codon:yes stop_codon:yes gene_type:complete